MYILRLTGFILLLVASFGFVAADVAEARIGGGKSFGSRGSRTNNAPPATNTAPNAAPIDRSTSPRAAAPSAMQNQAAQPSRFGGMRGLLMGGLFVAALGGIFGFGALASALGFMLQFALIAGLIYLAYSFFRRRSQPAYAQAQAGTGSQPQNRADTLHRQGLAAGGGAPLQIGQADLDSFEKILGTIQTAYSREDTDTLADMSTPEMLTYFLQELREQAEEGVRNEISGVKLLQGDIAESWREGDADYATVAMRYALTDVTLDRATGRVVAGDPSHPTEATELWTFRRDTRAGGDGWQLSAIQQTS